MTHAGQAGTITLGGKAQQVGGEIESSCSGKTLEQLRSAGQHITCNAEFLANSVIVPRDKDCWRIDHAAPGLGEGGLRVVYLRLHRTSRVILLILPVNRVPGPMPIPRRPVSDCRCGRRQSGRQRRHWAEFLNALLGDGFPIHGERRVATLADSAAVIGEVEGDRCWTRRQRFRCSDGVARQPEEVVGVDRLAVLHVQRPTAKATALRQDRAVGASGRDVEISSDLARPVL